eukprot:351077-Amphidinium_carterae.1
MDPAIGNDGKIVEPEFLKDAFVENIMIFASTAPFPLGTLKNDFTRQRNQQDAEAYAKGTDKKKATDSLANSASAADATVEEADKDTREKLLSSPGVEHLSSDSDDDDGAQDAQDKATEGPLAARKIGDYKPTYIPSNSARYENATKQPTGSDARWRDRLKWLGIRLHHQGQDITFVLPVWCEVSTQCAVVRPHVRKFRFDMSADKPKFLMEPNVKIPWMGKPLFEVQEKPSSMDTVLDNQVVDIYRNIPTSQLSSESPASDLRDRLSRTVEGNIKFRPLVPAAMTSKLRWTKIADLVDDGALGGTLARAP